jgi:hypothetical protein
MTLFCAGKDPVKERWEGARCAFKFVFSLEVYLIGLQNWVAGGARPLPHR